MFNEFSRHEDAFQQWVRGGYPDAKRETLDYLHHLSDPEDDTRPREGTLWPHQWDSLLRVIYAYEIERDALTKPNGLLLNVVTGGGKTAIIAAIMAWLRLAHEIKTFVLLCPNLIVRDRLEEDFQDGKVFAVIETCCRLAQLRPRTTSHCPRWGATARKGGRTCLARASSSATSTSFIRATRAVRSNLAALMNGPDYRHLQ